MSKTFTCCELVERIKQLMSESNSYDEDKYQAIEFLHKAALKITNRRIKEWANFNGEPKPVWTHDSDYLFCEECQKWFDQQEEKQAKLIYAEIEKEKAEGKYFGPRNPKTYEGTIIEDTVKRLKEQEQEKLSNKNKSSSPFWQKPAGIILIAGSLGILGFLLGYYFTRRRKQQPKN